MNELTALTVAYLLPLALALITFAMGLGLVTHDFRSVLKDPKASLIGLFGQLLILPALAFLIAIVFNLPSAYAIGLVLVAACPGGLQSNLFTNLAKGDVALSISLTTFSGLICILTIPLYVYLATGIFSGFGTFISLSISQMLFQLVTIVIVPALLGMTIRYKYPRAAIPMEKGVKALAIVLLTVIVVGSFINGWNSLAINVWQVTAAVMALNIMGMWIGALLARAYHLPTRQVITITTEVGVQNTTLAFGIAMAFLSNFLIAVPAVIYAVLVYATGITLIVIGRLVMRKRAPSSLFPA